MAKERLWLDMSVESYELLQKALRVYLRDLAAHAGGLEAVEDAEGLSLLKKDYHHGKALSHKMWEGRSIVSTRVVPKVVEV